jgi:hypothetical protein
LLDVLFLRAEGFSCSLGVLLLRHRDKLIAVLDQKINKKNLALNFFQFLVIKTLYPELDPDPDPQL